MTDLVLLGGGGHARSVLAALRLAGEDVRGFLAPGPSDRLPDVLRLGGDDVLDELDPLQTALINGLGPVAVRQRLHDDAVARGFTIRSIVHPRAFVDAGADLGDGVQILAGAIVNAGARIGHGALVNSGAIVEHDTTVGAHSHIAPGAVLAGDVRIGDGAHVGLGARIMEGLTVGSGSIIGAGAVVLHDVAAATTVVGVPARDKNGER